MAEGWKASINILVGEEGSSNKTLAAKDEAAAWRRGADQRDTRAYVSKHANEAGCVVAPVALLQCPRPLNDRGFSPQITSAVGCVEVLDRSFPCSDVRLATRVPRRFLPVTLPHLTGEG